MTDRTDLIEQIRTLAVVHGKVTLASGREADYYVDMRRVTLDGVASPLVGRVMNDLVADLEFDAVGGLTLGADPVATAMLHARATAGGRLDAFVVRKESKSEPSSCLLKNAQFRLHSNKPYWMLMIQLQSLQGAVTERLCVPSKTKCLRNSRNWKTTMHPVMNWKNWRWVH